MLRSAGLDKATGKSVMVARCGERRPYRSSDPFPADFTGWEQDVSCPRCVLPTIGKVQPCLL